ncbi:hypothetical protein [Streptomyces baarnensis]|uniref:hypothetical protein n=1 Tax=Streptomyces baarnensis TaxID=66872 RepID=UPI00067AE85F|nr:hypothetical protein [Streptomyces baarnensis]
MGLALRRGEPEVGFPHGIPVRAGRAAAARQLIAQHHFIQALRPARAGGDADLGSYILATMAMQSLMRGFTSEAIDRAQGAYRRGQTLDPRVAGFAKLIEARSHARAGDERSTSTWNAAGPMPSDAFVRSRSVRLSVLASAHAQNGDLAQSLHLGRESLALFTRLGSLRGMEYLRVYGRSLEPWRRDPQVITYLADVRRATRSLAEVA